MLFGGYQHNIDKKGRIFIPSKLREQLGESFIICRAIYKKPCLWVYSLTEWEALVERISQLPNAKSSGMRRFLFEGAFNVEFDAQGRILIPASLREYAELEGDAHIIGMDKNLEIWNTALWEEEKGTYSPETIAAMAEDLEF
ncbi:MAG: division/cell wall cluster transcriptional repressor MraZ [Clostridia bacterium]|nr:division/cell wall cluster transcriptional repressor MraZ [Clostridia bacterium]